MKHIFYHFMVTKEKSTIPFPIHCNIPVLEFPSLCSRYTSFPNLLHSQFSITQLTVALSLYSCSGQKLLHHPWLLSFSHTSNLLGILLTPAPKIDMENDPFPWPRPPSEIVLKLLLLFVPLLFFLLQWTLPSYKNTTHFLKIIFILQYLTPLLQCKLHKKRHLSVLLFADVSKAFKTVPGM